MASVTITLSIEDAEYLHSLVMAKFQETADKLAGNNVDPNSEVPFQTLGLWGAEIAENQMAYRIENALNNAIRNGMQKANTPQLYDGNI